MKRKRAASLLSMLMVISLAVMLAPVGKSYANETRSGKCGENAYWSLTGESEKLTLTISGYGDMYDYGYGIMPPWYEDAKESHINTIAFTEDSMISSIGANSFCDCYGLRTVENFPEKITKIGNNAFRNCDDWETDLELSDSVTEIGESAFRGCKSLKSVKLGKRIHAVPDAVFWDCSNIKYVMVKGEIEKIGSSFGNGTSLVSVQFDSTVKNIDSKAFFNCPNLEECYLPEGLERIGGLAFARCGSLPDSYYIPSTVKSLGDDAFQDSSVIKLQFYGDAPQIEENAYGSDDLDMNSIAISYDDSKTGWSTPVWEGYTAFPREEASIIKEGNYGAQEDNIRYVYNSESKTLYFLGSGKLRWHVEDFVPWNREGWKDYIKKAVVCEGITNLTSNTFRYCGNLQQVYLPESLTEIESWAFDHCSKLQEIEIPENVEKTGYEIFAYSGVRNVVLPKKLKDMYSGMFYRCYNLESVIMPESIEFGGIADMFFQCLKIKEITIPQNVKNLYENSFYKCESLEQVTIPSSVMEIEEGTFSGCSSLHDIYYQGLRAQWNQITGKNYINGARVHCIDDEDILKADIMGHNLNLSGSIGVNYYIHLSDEVLKDEGAKVHFDLPNGFTSEVLVKDAKVKTVKGVECREFRCKLHSSQMTGIVKAKVIMSDGTESEEFPYTVKEYADLMIENPDNNASFTKVTPLIKAMLNYGGYAQQYFKYDDNPLANKDLTEEERNAIQTVTAEDVKDFERVVTGSQEGLKYEGSNLMLTSETCIRHFFTVQSGHDISEYTFKLDGKKLTPVKSGKMYYVEIPNIASGNLDKTYTVTAGGITIQYSAMSYVYTQLSKTDLDADLANTLKALYLYNKEANLYYKE